MPETDLHAELDEVFGRVADQTRLDILRALWEARLEADRGERPVVPFSTLRERVGVRDSGRFNYHLDKLVPDFARSDDDGYTLTYAGARIIGAAVSGVYGTAETEFETFALGACSDADCDGTIEALYEDHRMSVQCDRCDRETVMTAPPIIVGPHDPEANPTVLGEYALTVLQKTVRGFCHLCNGPVEATVQREEIEGLARDHVDVVHECQACGSVSYTSAASVLVDDPAVIARFHEAGVDLRDLLLWREAGGFGWEEVVRTDPFRIDVRFQLDGEEFVVTLNEQLDVTEYDATRTDSEG